MIQASNNANPKALPNDASEMPNHPATTIINQNSGVDLQSFNHFDTSLRNGMTGLNMPTQVAINSDYQVCHEPLPFDSLNVQDLWNWMGDLDDYDNYSYRGSYESNGTM